MVDNFHFFSDEEGMAPFKTGFYHAELDGYLEFEDGIISGVKREDDKLVFLGDLIDHGPKELLLLNTMIRLHDENKAVLIAGNRDVNKIRMGWELQIVTTTGDAVDLSDVEDLAGLWKAAEEIIQFVPDGDTETSRKTLDYEYKHTTPGYVIDALKKRNVYESKSLETDRMGPMYTQTMGVSYNARSRAASLGFDLPDEFGNNPTTHVFMALLHCIMAGGQKVGDGGKNLEVEIGGIKVNIAGIYLRYLMASKVVDLLETIGGKRILISHAGVPNTLSFPLGVQAGARKPANLSEVIEKVNAHLHTLVSGLRENGFVETFMVTKIEQTDGESQEQTDGESQEQTDGESKEKTTSETWTTFDEISYYVAMSAYFPDPDETRDSVKKKKFSSFSSPIVSDLCRREPGHRATRFMSGGDWMRRYDGDNEVLVADTTKPTDATNPTDAKIDYVLFGHTPQGHAPTVWREPGSQTTFVCLDVSKAPGTTTRGLVNNPDKYFTHAVVSIGSDGDFVRGSAEITYDEREKVEAVAGVREIAWPVGPFIYKNDLGNPPPQVEGLHYKFDIPSSDPLPQRLYHKTGENYESVYRVQGYHPNYPAQGGASRSKNWATAGVLLLATIFAAAMPR